MNIRASQNNLARELFVRTADENYMAARWCAMNRLNTDFLWLSVHALEKYLKAVLLVNGCSTKGYSHDVVRLYAAVKAIAGPLLPERLVKPSNLDISWWRERSTEEFLQHLLNNGNADNRYLIYGYVTTGEDLHMLDEVVFAVRRLVCQLDDPFIQSRDARAPTDTNRQVLQRSPSHYGRLNMPLDQQVNARQEDTPLRRAALNLNMAFAPEDYEHEGLRSGTSARNPVIIRRILDPLSSNERARAAEGVEIARWFLENVQIPRGSATDLGVREQIEAAVAAARSKHGLA